MQLKECPYCDMPLEEIGVYKIVSTIIYDEDKEYREYKDRETTIFLCSECQGDVTDLIDGAYTSCQET